MNTTTEKTIFDISEISQIDKNPLINKWILNILFHLEGWKNLSSSDDLLEKMIDCDDINLKTRAHREHLKSLIVKAYKTQTQNDRVADEYVTLVHNVHAITKLLCLSFIEKQLLLFVICLSDNQNLENAVELLKNNSVSKIPKVMAKILDVPLAEMKRALKNKSNLMRSGLIKFDSYSNGRITRCFDFISDMAAEKLITNENIDPLDLISDMVLRCRPAKLMPSDYGHIKQEFDLCVEYLTQVKKVNAKGVNIFIYGKPGTGKSEMARLLAEMVGYDIYEISPQDEDGDPMGRTSRLRAFQAAQNFFESSKSMFLFDEVEDVFQNNNSFFSNRDEGKYKAWLNHYLEQNNIPTVWVSNSASCVDDAHIRRFDIVIELGVPPKSQRKKNHSK